MSSALPGSAWTQRAPQSRHSFHVMPLKSHVTMGLLSLSQILMDPVKPQESVVIGQVVWLVSSKAKRTRAPMAASLSLPSAHGPCGPNLTCWAVARSFRSWRAMTRRPQDRGAGPPSQVKGSRRGWSWHMSGCSVHSGDVVGRSFREGGQHRRRPGTAPRVGEGRLPAAPRGHQPLSLQAHGGPIWPVPCLCPCSAPDAEFSVSSADLDAEHAQKVLETEHTQQAKLKERQKFFEEAFQQDMEQYLSTGYLQIAERRGKWGGRAQRYLPGSTETASRCCPCPPGGRRVKSPGVHSGVSPQNSGRRVVPHVLWLCVFW